MADELAWLPPHKAGLILRHNDHLNVYETAEDVILQDEANHGPHGADFVSPEQRQKAIETNEIWELHWYPDTPVGFYRLRAAELSALIAAVQEENDTP